MARQESDREDLLREATGLTQRIELETAVCEENVVVGFRRDGAGSIFFGADPVLQFNSSGQLRRAFWQGRLIKAVRGCLVELTRVRTPDEVQLMRRDLDGQESAMLLTKARQLIDRLGETLNDKRFAVVGQVPAEGDLVERVRAWLKSLADEITIADRPNAR